MRRRHVSLVLSLACACSTLMASAACFDVRIDLGDDDPHAPHDAGGPPSFDSAAADVQVPDAYVPSCTHGSPFQSERTVLGLESTSVVSARFSPDERTAYLSVGVQGHYDLYTAERGSATGAFGTLTKLSASTSTDDYWPTVSPDGLTMFFESGVQVDGGVSNTIWFGYRDSVPGTFTTTIPAAFAIVDGRIDAAPYLVGSSLYWMSMGRNGAATLDLWTANVGGNGTIAGAHALDAVNTTTRGEAFPVVSSDEKEMFFARQTSGAYDDIEMAERAATSSPFTDALPIGLPVNSASASEWPSWVSPDDCRLYFIRSDSPNGSSGPWHLWVAERSKP